MEEMRNWSFSNGIEVIEKPFDYDLHLFEVYNNGEYLGSVYPGSIEDMQACVHDLDEGTDPIKGGWEDGNGNTCSLDGWGE